MSVVEWVVYCDETLIRWCERICHGIYRTFGISHFWILRVMLVWGICVQGIEIGGYWVRSLTPHQPNIPLMVTAAAVFIYLNYVYQKFTAIERRWQSNPVMLPSEIIEIRESEHPIRVICVSMSISILILSIVIITFGLPLPKFMEGEEDHLLRNGAESFIDTIDALWALFGWPGHFYVKTVRPLPPAPSRVRQWVTFFRPVPVTPQS